MVNPRSRFTCSMVELSQTALNAFLIALAYLCGEMWRQCGGEYWDSRDGQRRWWSFGLGKICHRYNHVEKRLLDHGYKCFPHTACGCQDTHQVTMWCKVCFTWCLRSQVRFTRAHDKELSLSYFFFGSYSIFSWMLRCCPTFHGSQPAFKKSSLSAKTYRENNFLYPLSMTEFAWCFIAKDYFLGGLSIFLDGFWLSS